MESRDMLVKTRPCESDDFFKSYSKSSILHLWRDFPLAYAHA